MKSKPRSSPVSSKEIFFDVETLRLSHEVTGGWSSIARFGLAVGVTWDPHNQFRRWFEPDAKALVQELSRFDRIITYNGERFDFEVLRGYHPVDGLYEKSLDLLADLHSKLGFRIKLDDLAQETLGRIKTGDGLEAVRWWRAGDREKVCKYCENDVQLLVDLVNFARANQYVLVDSRRLPVDWR